MRRTRQDERPTPQKRARAASDDEAEAEEEEAEQFECGMCSARFTTRKRLNEHTKRAHAPASDRTCPHCNKLFSNAASLPRHLRICPQQPEVAIKCVIPASKVPPSPTAPHNKARSGKKCYAAVERYLARLVAYLEKGDFMYSHESRLERLAALTITSYKSFVRKFLEAVMAGLVAGHGDETLAEENNDATYKKMVHVFCKLDTISEFVWGREQDNFMARSQVNLLCALLWHLAFVTHLTHPRVSTSTWDSEDLQLRMLLLPQLQSKAAEFQEQLLKSHRYLRQQIGRLKDRADLQVQARNSQEALRERGTWITIDWMSTMARALDEEGWARLHRLEAVLQTTPASEFLGLHGQQ